MKIYVVRHGQTELNAKGLITGGLEDKLTPKGEEQARAAVAELPHTIKRIYSSSLNRARQTANIINEALQLPISYHDELQEVNFGDLNGTPYLEEYKEKHRSMEYDWRQYGGESMKDVKDRILSILKKIKAENGDGEALIVAHGGTIRMLHFLETGQVLGEVENASLSSFDLDTII